MTIRTDTDLESDEREDLILIRQIADRIPALRALAESLGAWRVVELLEKAEEQALSQCEPASSAEVH